MEINHWAGGGFNRIAEGKPSCHYFRHRPKSRSHFSIFVSNADGSRVHISMPTWEAKRLMQEMIEEMER